MPYSPSSPARFRERASIAAHATPKPLIGGPGKRAPAVESVTVTPDPFVTGRRAADEFDASGEFYR